MSITWLISYWDCSAHRIKYDCQQLMAHVCILHPFHCLLAYAKTVFFFFKQKHDKSKSPISSPMTFDGFVIWFCMFELWFIGWHFRAWVANLRLFATKKEWFPSFRMLTASLHDGKCAYDLPFSQIFLLSHDRLWFIVLQDIFAIEATV